MKLARLIILLFGFMCVVPSLYADDKHVKHKQWTKKYDRLFKKYSKHYFGPSMDWHWFKAQAIAESGLKPNVRSKVGAIGLMQIMPATYKEIKSKNKFLKDVETPRWNIAAGIYYDRYLYKRWLKKLSGDDHMRFAFASYNAGFGRVSRAWRQKNKPQNWEDVAHKAPGQTRHYVRRIENLMRLVD